ncbi:MAG: tetratricopeptide repeat protein [Anderseniella sp.]
MKKALVTLSTFAAFAIGTAVSVPVHAQQAGEAHKIPGLGQGPGLHNPDSSTDTAEVLDRLFGQLRQAENEKSAQLLENAIQELWLRSGSPTADLLMKQAGNAMGEQQYGAALVILDTVVEQNPDFAEGWNRRATLHFLRGDFSNSLRDIDQVLALEPRHYGALSGQGAIFKQRGDGRKALRALRRARTVNPRLKNVNERIRQLEQEFDQKI